MEWNRTVCTQSRNYATVALVLGVCLLSGCSEKKDAKQAEGQGMAMPVSAIKATPTDVPLTGEWVGTMDGNVNAQIQPQVTGYLLQQTYREGSQVQKGQLLFKIDPRTFQATLDQMQGQLGQAKAQLQLAQINVRRDTPLAKERAIAQSQLDTETQQLAQAEAAVKTAEASVESAQINLGFTEVRSLISGVAGQATTQIGNLVSPQSVLTAVSQVDPIRVYFSISDSEYLNLVNQARVNKGDLLRGASNIPLTLRLSNGETYPHKGKIAFVDRQINVQTGAIRIAALFANPGNVLRPGQFGRVRAETQIRHNVILVPQSAIMEMQGVPQAYTVGAGNKVHVVSVKVGAQYGDSLIIEDGLPAGTQVITDNLQKLREGAPVAPHQVSFDPEPTTSKSAAGR